jgi:hypothetical protein
MNEALVQAVERLITIFVVAGLVAIGADLTILKDAISDPTLATFVFAIGTAVIDAVLKYIGGATMPTASMKVGLLASDRPHWWAV